MRRRRKKKSYAQEVLEAAQAASEDRAAPPCAFHHDCGGCSWQTLPYELQLQAKADFIAKCFEAAGFARPEVDLPLPSPKVYGYRNQMEFSFAARRWLTADEISSGQEFDRDFALGLHAPGGFDRVLSLDHCDLQDEAANRVFRVIKSFCRDSGAPAYNPRSHEGFWRYLNIRKSFSRPELMVCLYTRDADETLIARLAEVLKSDAPEVTSFVHAVTNSIADTSEGATHTTIFGPGFLRENMGGLDFEISSQSFFQPNSLTAGIVFDTAAELADVRPGQGVLDLFCGTGTLSLWMAQKGARVRGLELSESAVACARENAQRNQLENCEFAAHDLLQGIPELDGFNVDTLITDPPRAGMHPKVIRNIVEFAPKRIVSIGCNPKTQALNLQELCDRGGYEIVTMKSVDQFPQTPHVENIALLRQAETH